MFFFGHEKCSLYGNTGFIISPVYRIGSISISLATSVLLLSVNVHTTFAEKNQNIHLKSHSNQTSIQLSWKSDNQNVKIHDFDNNKIYSGNDNKFNVSNLSFNKNEKSQNSVPLTSEETNQVKSWYLDNGKEVTDEELKKISNRPYSIIKIVDTSKLNSTNNTQVSVAAAATVSKSLAWTYKTFIPDAYAKDPWYNPAT
ncbi:hypothetical protein [Paenibacillus sp. MMS18-CY102]|uniref:hypothetical protein n=1 Tax=Paenibacillus sp. MMS18-CY102 TaxID=2682849 RepID=UPI001365F74E|nr:hypothetical protein [Paenibacillus sp. MMS18-CY102]MWC28798.1 hypothetical protein [Paenibacillus sp. MMS18-CY102]